MNSLENNLSFMARYWAIAKSVFFPSELRDTSCALGPGQIPQRQKFRPVIANLHSNLSMKKRSVNRLKQGEEPRKEYARWLRSCFSAQHMPGKLKGLKKPKTFPRHFHRCTCLLLLVDFLFLNRYIKSGALAPHSAVGRIVRRILRRKKWSGSGNHNSVYIH
jgi:hypothetical protein